VKSKSDPLAYAALAQHVLDTISKRDDQLTAKVTSKTTRIQPDQQRIDAAESRNDAWMCVSPSHR
jgi:hypothetical protein